MLRLTPTPRAPSPTPPPADGKYHRLDRFGHKLPTIVVPLAAEAEEAPRPGGSAGAAGASLAEAVAAPEHVASDGGSVSGEMEYMNNKVGWAYATPR